MQRRCDPGRDGAGSAADHGPEPQHDPPHLRGGAAGEFVHAVRENAADVAQHRDDAGPEATECREHAAAGGPGPAPVAGKPTLQKLFSGREAGLGVLPHTRKGRREGAPVGDDDRRASHQQRNQQADGREQRRDACGDDADAGGQDGEHRPHEPERRHQHQAGAGEGEHLVDHTGESRVDPLD